MNERTPLFRMPLALRWQKPLAWAEGMLAARAVDEVLLLCRQDAAAHGALSA